MNISLPAAFFAGSPGPMELIVIFLLILVLFGPRRLPEIAKMIGKTVSELRRASEDFKDQVMSIESDPIASADAAEQVDALDLEGSNYPEDMEDVSDYDDYADQMAEGDDYAEQTAEDVLIDDDIGVAEPELDAAESDIKEQVV